MDKEYYEKVAKKLGCSICIFCDQVARINFLPCCGTTNWATIEDNPTTGQPEFCHTKTESQSQAT